MNVLGKKQWVHTVGSKTLVHFALHEKRGKQATEAIGILPEFTGTLVHDHWKSYFLYDKSQHALCNAHHLRELRFLYEHHHMKWAKALADLLVGINHHKNKHIESGKDRFSPYRLNQYNAQYDEILKKARREHRRHVTKDAHNLLKRLTTYKQETLLFMHDFNVPFTNNLSERDLRMLKIKQKISGCFRKASWGNNFCRIRSFIISTKKNDKNVFKMIQKAFHKRISVKDILQPT